MLKSFLENVESARSGQWELVHHERMPARPARTEPLPSEVDPEVAGLVTNAGISELYSHQAEAIRLSLQGKHVALATSTASGKTLAYQVPVISKLIADPSARALFLFPLKALERDQRDAFAQLAGPADLSVAVYDGDTPDGERRKIRKAPPRVLITNPDMLHVAMLAHHDIWREFFAHLVFVVLDEVHTYKGIFGSHIAQVLARLRRICSLYGGSPQFFACSATISNPGELFSRLVGHEAMVVDQSGAASPGRHFLFLRPELSPYTVATRLFVAGLKAGLKTIVFTRARRVTELITTWVMAEAPEMKPRISSYRAGFLPDERREIERRLFSGLMDGVITTSALEMGIDVGGLDLCILVGYPGTIISTWQRGGRVGRGGKESAIALIAANDALDQYFLSHPADFFARECERAILDPFNEEVLKRHLPCAAAESPLQPGEEWIAQPAVRSVADELVVEGRLYRPGNTSAWYATATRPHREVDLLSIGSSFTIFRADGKRPLGSSSGSRVFSECHEGAVYLHRAGQYLITRLDLKRKNVFAKKTRVNYYTRAVSEKDTEIVRAPTASQEFPGYVVREARLKVTEQITGYEKRRASSQELMGFVDLDLPAVHFETVGIWIEIPDEVKTIVEDLELDFMGGIHALEHANISIFPLFALCDRDDVGGISTPHHVQVGKAAIFIYDGHPGGVGLAHHMFGRIEEVLDKTRSLVTACACETGCPSCIHSPKCGSGNKPLDKQACLTVLELLLHPEKKESMQSLPQPRSDARTRRVSFPRQQDMVPGKMVQNRKRTDRARKRIFPDLFSGAGSDALEARDRGAHVTSGIKDGASMPGSDHTAPAIAGARAGVVVFDLETQRLAQEVGGWRNAARMGVSLAVAHSERDGFLTFSEERIPALIDLLCRADLVVGFNQLRFDYEVLKAYTDVNLQRLPNLDILQEIEKTLGFRLKLDSLAEHTLGRQKSGHGVEAVQWFREGRLDLLEQYCTDDVSITRDLYLFGREHGFLLYKGKDRTIARVRVDWPGLRSVEL